MNIQTILKFAKKQCPVEITGGEAFLDQAILELSKRFVRCMDSSIGIDSETEPSEDPWFEVFIVSAALLLNGRSGKIHFTEKSFAALGLHPTGTA